MLLVEVVREGWIDNNIIPLLPSYNCPLCGHFLHINDTFTSIYCNNGVCPSHMTSRMVDMLKDLKVRDLGESRCMDIIRKCKMTHHTDILYLDVDELPNQFSYSTRLKWIEQINTPREVSMGELVSYFQLPNLGLTRAQRIFEGIQNLEGFFETYNTKDKLIHFVAERLSDSAYTYNVGVLPVEIGTSLWEEKEYLTRFQSKFKIRKITAHNLTVIMTGEIRNVVDDNGYVFKPRESFISWLNKRYEGVITIKLGTVSSSDFVIADRPSSSSKYREGERTGKLITSDKLLLILDKFTEELGVTERGEEYVQE